MKSKELRAVLIQDLTYLTREVFPKLVTLHNSQPYQFNLLDFYYWMICELTFKVYSIPIANHPYPHPSFDRLWGEIKNVFLREQISLEQYFKYYIKAPDMYSDTEMKVSIIHEGRHLIFEYYSGMSSFPKSG